MQLGSSKTIKLLQTFEAVGRSLSVTKAAEELGVTTSAVSHQLRELSEILGGHLTEKSGRGITLTPVGVKLARELRELFTRIEQSVMEAISGDVGSVRIAVCSSFGPGWLAPRYNDLLADFPNVEFQTVLRMAQPHLNDLDADIFITTQPGAPGFWSAPLFEEVLWAVGSPARRQADPRMRSSRFITTDTLEGSVGADWFSFTRQTRFPLDLANPNVWVKTTHYMLAVEMARQGVGIALVPDFLARTHIENGSLEIFHKADILSGRQYHVCIKRSRLSEPLMEAVINWLKRQVQATAAIYAAQAGFAPKAREALS